MITHDHAPPSALIIELLSRELKISAADIKPELPLTQYGLDSIAALTIAGELEDELGLELPSTLLWDCPTITELADYLAAMLTERNAVSVAG
jgi:acyl carrier protein